MLSELFFSMLICCCIGAICSILIRIIVCLTRHQKIVLRKEEIPIVLFASYCFGLLSQTVPIILVIRYGNQMVNGGYHNVNLVPFRSITKYITGADSIGGISLANVLGNVLLFVPMGLLLPIIFKKCNSPIKVILIGAIVSALIEITQYFLGRSADIDDVILNVIGTVVGVGVYSVLKGLIER